MAGVFYAYSVSVDPGLAAQSDASYVATMQEINERIQNPLFFASFVGAVLFLLAALVLHLPRPRSGRFLLISLACVLYIGGGFLLTAFVNVPMNDQLASRRPRRPGPGPRPGPRRLRRPMGLLERSTHRFLDAGVSGSHQAPVCWRQEGTLAGTAPTSGRLEAALTARAARRIELGAYLYRVGQVG